MKPFAITVLSTTIGGVLAGLTLYWSIEMGMPLWDYILYCTLAISCVTLPYYMYYRKSLFERALDRVDEKGKERKFI